MDLEKLRSVVRDCLGKHLYSTAVFVADKLVTLSDSDASDVYLLAQAYFMSKHYRRALHLLCQENLLTVNTRFKYLAALCLEKVKEWEECLALLGEEEQQGGDNRAAADMHEEEMTDASDGREISITAAMCLLRGKAYEALENRKKALYWYRASLVADPFCYEAFEHLIDNHMLTADEEQSLLSTLRFEPEDRWLYLMYCSRAKKYGPSTSIEQKFEDLEKGSRVVEQQAAASPSQEGTVVSWSLKDNNDLVACKADHFYQRGEYRRAYEITKTILERDPYHMGCMPVHLASTLELGRKNELYIRAHRLVQEYPHQAIAWFAVGCYYYCIRQYDHARRYFCKATALDGVFAAAWLGFGHAYAAQDESDQAMAAYRTATRLFAGLHLPALCIGMEYARTNNFNLAEQFFVKAQQINPSDPLVCNELGALAYRNKDYVSAAKWLRKSLSLVAAPLTEAWEPTVVNLAHSLRKQKNYGEAVSWYERALTLCPKQGGTYGALGFTTHLQGRTAQAIEYYHKALEYKPDDSFIAEMLTTAIMEECSNWASSNDDPLLAPAAPMGHHDSRLRISG